MMLENKKISLVIPVFNEKENLDLLYEKISQVLTRENFEIIFVNDGSTDGSMEKLQEIIKLNNNFKIINFSRNFGKEIAITAGINHCQGDACIIMDADLQHPPELIPEFLQKWQAGVEVVVGVREKNQGEGLIKRVGSFFFYKIMSLIGDTKMISRSTDFRLLDKKVIKAFNKFTEQNRISRGLIDWLGFKNDYIYFVANPRNSGKPAYNIFKLIRLALSTFISHSLFPLKLAGYLGIIITFFSGIFGLFIIIEKYILGDPLGLYFSGPAMLAIMILFLIGIVLICLGLVALYIANINTEVINRPLYIIREKINFDEHDQV